MRAIDAIGPDHQGNHGIVEKFVDPAVDRLRVHVESFPLEAGGAFNESWRKRRLVS